MNYTHEAKPNKLGCASPRPADHLRAAGHEVRAAGRGFQKNQCIIELACQKPFDTLRISW